jgi:hypothetical protein
MFIVSKAELGRLCCRHAYMLQGILEGRRGLPPAVLVKYGKYVLLF